MLTYIDIVLHQGPAAYIDLLKIGLFPAEWKDSLRPTSTRYPIYSTLDGVGQTSIIVRSLYAIELPVADRPEHQPALPIDRLA